MDSPQLENGYTMIAHEILEQMAKIKLSPTQYRLIFIIWRYTYGFKRKEHDLSLKFLANATGCDKRQIQRELSKLEERKIITQKIHNGINRKLSFNKNYKQWVGEIAIGETTNGEIDNGETVNPTIGETVKGTIGETDNQEIYKDNIKDNVIFINNEEMELIRTLESVKGYPLNRESEIEMFKRLSERYPTIDIICVVKEWAISKLDKPLKKKDNPRSQINTWCSNSLKWNKNLKKVTKNDGPYKKITC